VVVVVVLVVVVTVVVDVEGMVQQKPTPAGLRITSAGLHASRIRTAVSKVPSWRGFAQRTAPWVVLPTIRITAMIDQAKGHMITPSPPPACQPVLSSIGEGVKHAPAGPVSPPP
jgi:hypothetical protein